MEYETRTRTQNNIYVQWEDKQHDLWFDLFEKDRLMSLGCEELLSHHNATKPVAQFMKGDRKAQRKVIGMVL